MRIPGARVFNDSFVFVKQYMYIAERTAQNKFYDQQKIRPGKLVAPTTVLFHADRV